MTTLLLILHLLVTLALIGVVLIQRSEGGGLGIGTTQGMGGFMSGRGTANLLTRTTAILGTAFLVLSLVLALLTRGTGGVGRSILDTPPATRQGAPSGAPVAPTPEATPGTAAPAPAAPRVPTQ
jgi:preprotein translocase subunit SecG